jgi:hypothetical protein
MDPAVIRRLRELPKNERVECLLALCDLLDGFVVIAEILAQS